MKKRIPDAPIVGMRKMKDGSRYAWLMNCRIYGITFTSEKNSLKEFNHE